MFKKKKELNIIKEDNKEVFKSAEEFKLVPLDEICDLYDLQVRTYSLLNNIIKAKKLEYSKYNKVWKSINDRHLTKELLSMIIGRFKSDISFYDFNIILFIFEFDGYIPSSIIKNDLEIKEIDNISEVLELNKE